MSDLFTTTAVGTRQVRLDGPAKVRGLAPYAYEHPLDDPLFLYPPAVADRPWAGSAHRPFRSRSCGGGGACAHPRQRPQAGGHG